MSPARVVVGGIKVGEADVGDDVWDDDEFGGGVDVCGDDKIDGDFEEYEVVGDGLIFSLSFNFLNNLSNLAL